MTTETETRWQRFERSSDAYLAVTVMLVLLIVVPIATPGESVGSVATALIAGAAATLAMAASQTKRWPVAISILATAGVIVANLVPGDHKPVVSLGGLILGVLLMSAPALIFRRIGKHRRVTGTTMWGAIAAYLSLGIALSFIYAAIHLVDPSAFDNVLNGTLGEFEYFSFVTMTTLGYGDITPASDLTRAIAVLQTVTGQIFLVVVVARIVALLGSDQGLRPDRQD